MLKDYEINKPILETDRLIIRKISKSDVADLKEWLGRDEIYTYWGRKASSIASNKVMEKCGFIKEGTIRQGKMVSVYCDYNIYGLLREDYKRLGVYQGKEAEIVKTVWKSNY